METRSRTIPRSVPVPSRNPSRKGSTRKVTATPVDLTDQQIHIWEHATTLYYGFEWQAAAETFSSLARGLKSDLEQALCIINTALICARLGDFAPALAILGESQPTKEVLPLTFFLMGHMNFALCELEQAESDFESALRALDNRPQSYRRYNVDFVLQDHHIKRSLSVLDTYRKLGSCYDGFLACRLYLWYAGQWIRLHASAIYHVDWQRGMSRPYRLQRCLSASNTDGWNPYSRAQRRRHAVAEFDRLR